MIARTTSAGTSNELEANKIRMVQTQWDNGKRQSVELQWETDGRYRDRTDDLYRVKGSGVVYPINSSWFSLLDRGGLCTVFGAYCSQIVPKFCSLTPFPKSLDDFARVIRR
jgi:hypothetical protein